MKNAQNDKMEHLKPNPFGENLWMKLGGPDPSCNDIVGRWYNEIEKYNWNKPGFSMQTGHFNQVVWKSTRRVGVYMCVVVFKCWVVKTNQFWIDVMLLIFKTAG